MTGFSPTLRQHAPLIGEHTRQILAEAGLCEEEITSMLQAGDAYQSDPGEHASIG